MDLVHFGAHGKTRREKWNNRTICVMSVIYLEDISSPALGVICSEAVLDFLAKLSGPGK